MYQALKRQGIWTKDTAWLPLCVILAQALPYLMQVERALANGSDVVLRIDVQGAETIRKLLPKSVHIFLVSFRLRFPLGVAVSFEIG